MKDDDINDEDDNDAQSEAIIENSVSRNPKQNTYIIPGIVSLLKKSN